VSFAIPSLKTVRSRRIATPLNSLCHRAFLRASLDFTKAPAASCNVVKPRNRVAVHGLVPASCSKPGAGQRLDRCPRMGFAVFGSSKAHKNCRALWWTITFSKACVAAERGVPPLCQA